jgi:hypothetical protein
MTIPISPGAQVLYTNELGFDHLATIRNPPDKRRVEKPHDRNLTTNVVDLKVFRGEDTTWLEFGIRHSAKRRPRTWRFEAEPGSDPYKPETAEDRVERYKKRVGKS